MITGIRDILFFPIKKQRNSD